MAYWLLRLGSAIVAVLPERAAIRLGEWAGRLWYLTDSKRRAMARRHMARVLGPDAEVDTATRSVFSAYGRYWAEVLWAREKRIPAMAAAVETVGLEYLERARDEGAGLIYAVPHVGNWEVAATASVGIGVPVMAVAESLSNRRLSSWFVGLRSSFGIEAVLAEPGRSLMKDLQGMVERNGAAALLCDRDLRGRGVPVEFFGEKTTLPAGPVSLAMRQRSGPAPSRLLLPRRPRSSSGRSAPDPPPRGGDPFGADCGGHPVGRRRPRGADPFGALAVAPAPAQLAFGPS